MLRVSTIFLCLFLLVAPALAQIDAHDFSVIALDWSPDGAWIASGGGDRLTKVWDATSGELVYTLPEAGREVAAVRFSHDGAWLAVGDLAGGVSIYAADTGELAVSIDTPGDFVEHLVWSPDDSRLYASINLMATDTNAPPAYVVAFDPADGSSLLEVPQSSGIAGLDLSPDGTRLAISTYMGAVGIWNAETGGQTTRFSIGAQGVGKLAWSSDGAWLAVVTFDNSVRLLNANSGAELWQMQGHTQFIGGLAWSPDGSVLASSSGSAIGDRDDDTIRLWDPTTGEQIALFSGHTNGIRALAWSPDGDRLVSGSDDGTLRLWEIE